MIISCNECESSFSVDDSLIKDTGSKVRCSKCDSVFVAYPQALETDESEELTLEGLDTSSGDLEENDEPLDSEDLLDELELDLDDFNDEPVEDVGVESESPVNDADGELELDLDLEDEDDIDLDTLEKTEAGDELPDLSDFEDLAGLDDESLALDDTDEELEDLGLDSESETDPEAEIEETSLEFEDDEELNLTNLDFDEDDDVKVELEAAADTEDLDMGLELDQDDNARTDDEMAEVGTEVEDADELDLSDLELEVDETPTTDDTAAAVSDDLDLSLEEQAPEQDEVAGAGVEIEDADELDLSDLELEFDEASGSEDAGAAASDDLELDIEEQSPGQDEMAETGVDVEDAEELDLSDLGLEVEESSGSDDTGMTASDDLELDIEEQVPGQDEMAEAGAEGEDAEELDLSDLELEVDETSGSDDTGPVASENLDLDLNLEEEAETIAGGQETAADGLDLSDLEEIIDSEETPGSQPAGQEAADDLQLDFDLETGEVAQTADAGETPSGDTDLDLSDLEQILETSDSPAAETTAGNEADELDLQFETDPPTAGTTDAPAVTQAGEDAQDDDLLDIEKMLEQGEDSAPDIEGGEEDLSLTMEAALDDASKAAEPDLDLDFDIESELQKKEEIFDDGKSANAQLESNLLDADDVDFLDNTGIEGESPQGDGMTDQFATDEFTDTQDEYGQTDVLEDFDDQMPEPAGPAKPARSRSKKPVFAVVVIFLLAIGALIIPKSLGIKIPYLSDIKVPYLSDMDIKIPYLSDWLNPQPKDVAGNLKIAPMDRTISGKFVNNSKVGRLFVIRGQIKNEYDHPRSFVKVTGKLYKKGQKLAKTTTVYCGNVIPDSDLTRMDIAAINKRMKNKYGKKRSNLKIKEGKLVPFMIVFDKLPNNLDEYTVEVASSSI